MNQPPVTCVIPCHNHAQWVNSAIDSVVAQDYPNKRIIVVDDGSEDGSTAAIMHQTPGMVGPVGQGEPEVYWGHRGASKTPVMLCRFSQARGPAFARNYGIKAGMDGTELFAFLDSDDVYLPGKISRSVAKWAEAPEHVGAVYTDYETLNERTGVRVREHKEPFSRERLFRECLPNMDSLVSKAAFEKVGLLDETLRTCEDYDLWLRLSERFMVVHVPEALLLLRVGDHSSTARVPSDTWQACWRRVMEKAQARMRGNAV